MSKICTDLEQSLKLIELGIDVKTANMIYPCLGLDYDGKPLIDDVAIPCESKLYVMHVNSECNKHSIPCWSLGALLEVMPKSIERYDSDRCYRHYSLNLFKAYRYCCSYSFGPSLDEENHRNLCCFGEDASWLDVIFKTICWLIENGYMKKTD